MKILYPLNVTGFDALSDDEKKEAYTEGEEIICAILYLENTDKARFNDIKKQADNDLFQPKTDLFSTRTLI